MGVDRGENVWKIKNETVESFKLMNRDVFRFKTKYVKAVPSTQVHVKENLALNRTWGIFLRDRKLVLNSSIWLNGYLALDSK